MWTTAAESGTDWVVFAFFLRDRVKPCAGSREQEQGGVEGVLEGWARVGGRRRGGPWMFHSFTMPITPLGLYLRSRMGQVPFRDPPVLTYPN